MNVLEQTEQKLKEQIHQAVINADLATEDQIPDIILEKPKDKAHGDFATNIAMQLARIAKKAPRQIADDIVENLNKSEASVEKVEIAGPGFINFFMKQDFLGEVIETVLSAGDNYGKSTGGNGEKVQVEFVSVNPTGDLHLGHARNAAFGDVLCNVFAAAGYEVEREYYINDAGNQINNLGLSVEARYLQEIGKDVDMPEDGYRGQAIIDIAKELVKEDGEKWADKDHEERLDFFKEYGLKASLRNIESDLKDFRVEFDHWFSERSLFKDGQIDDTLAVLDDGGYTFEKDGALWFKTTEFGDDKDRVLIKGDGNYTYLTPDIAYHKNKLDRGFDRIINVWGSDHHGYIPRMRAALQALGYPVEKFDVKIIQMVNLFEAGEKVKMSKRTGKAVSLRELMDEVGIDAVRYYFVARSNDSQLDFDMDLAKSQSNDNPVYYAQYAHARICTMLSQAKCKGFNTEAEYDASLLTAEKELDLLKKIGELPQMIVDAADKHTPHKVTQYIFELATLLHSFYNAEKVLDANNEARTHARIALMKAVRQTLANAMTIIGISAPEKM
ncbi:arginine--tRNA ligase [Oceanobacillus kimchii]|uniref:arginine--tRNA ligase n=1 Tax=Oceanobacillus kimchii TaxID=746691 RepID=UPI0021A7F9B8|nr:arginine--tRNA ligase [Oceanobacillus kimchii]MCT1576665.1 arginine--tRNA ligase [Oceanobacillus kimchii]MCT2134735.1 arginine--tRNA ligase [Oceanobacillus kimchii]